MRTTPPPTLVYIAGPMSGLPNDNREAFYAAERRLRKLGYQTVNPARLHGHGPRKAWAEYLKLDLREMVLCDLVVLLPGWEESRGATLECAVATMLEIRVRHLSEFMQEVGP